MGFYHYEPLSEYIESMMRYEHPGLTCLIFPLEIDAGDEAEVKVEYDTPLSIYDSRALGGEISYWYCYLVGSGRY
ncbi:MAG: hypothetical protein JXA22_05455 [Candidatus Thermoplasmatota archaeon]|nr:hypothetical protein [Candidatus Thermoplasmatota archaeon]